MPSLQFSKNANKSFKELYEIIPKSEERETPGITSRGAPLTPPEQN